MTWDRSYGVFETPGDWYPDEEYWGNDKGYPGDADHHRNPTKGTIEEYRRATRERFWEGRKSGAVLFYVLPRNCDSELLQKHFPGSYYYERSGLRDTTATGAIKTSKDKDLRAWCAGGTSYAKEVRRDFERIVPDFRPSGFAFDNAFGAVMYGGPAQRGMPDRSWVGDRTVVAGGSPAPR